MPELPEVETIKRYLEREILGQRIKKIEIFNQKQIKGDWKKIIGLKIKKIERRGKILIFKLENDKHSRQSVLLIHLKLTGQLLLNSEKSKTTRAIFYLNKDKLIFNDARKFGYLKFLDAKDLERELKNLGPEALKVNFKNFQQIILSSKKPVKTLLMDQTKIAGIGNIYANEALFLAKIHPLRKANELNKKEIKNLFQAIKIVLKKGIKYEGTSSRFYLKPDQTKGKYQEKFLVYQRKNEECLECKNKVKYIKIRGRGTFFCFRCQKWKE